MAHALTVGVIGAMIALIAAFVRDPTDPPRGSSLGQALWALGHRPAFYPLVLLGVAGPAATWIALSVRGPHRRVLIVAWVVCIAVLAVGFSHRIGVMAMVLVEHGGA